ncbi:hypothetical protein RBA41_01970 [Massilia sp. CCM 9210]|uniref:hypothetical protein n=1 Tax=Massilia scottii TaxID=3057166 RepID=UPI00279651F0|nr:hypothetical protein [Massilia sp. CCM 9210]MDQ1812060.1 hypothetical protein [Massilia sp. CCM 9210]
MEDCDCWSGDAERERPELGDALLLCSIKLEERERTGCDPTMAGSTDPAVDERRAWGSGEGWEPCRAETIAGNGFDVEGDERWTLELDEIELEESDWSWDAGRGRTKL